MLCLCIITWKHENLVENCKEVNFINAWNNDNTGKLKCENYEMKYLTPCKAITCQHKIDKGKLTAFANLKDWPSIYYVVRIDSKYS